MTFVLLTGPPGVGKTTLAKKVADLLKQQNLSIQGFVTQEVRNAQGERKGFDVIDINNDQKRKPLAISDPPGAQKGPKVGKYTVLVSEFESIALDCFQNVDSCDVLIIDEIGKMEMFSKKFPLKVNQVFAKNMRILATIPNKIPPSGELSTLLNSLKKNPKSKLIQVTKVNRDELANEITSMLK